MKQQPVRVLIADDHAPTRHELERVLEADPRFRVAAAVADAAAAIEAATQHRPDLCLLDVRMPGSGVSATWEIAARLPETRIVILTVSNDEADLFAALQAGAFGYLLKDVDFRQLPDLLAAVMEGHAAVTPALVSTLVEAFRSREARRRSIIATGPRSRLTSREWQVLELMAKELTTVQIAHRLVLTQSTVRSHITRILQKLDAKTRREAVEVFRLG